LRFFFALIALPVAAFLGGCSLGDADQQEAKATACLHSAGLEVQSNVPSGGTRGHVAPEIELEIFGRVPAGDPAREEGGRANLATIALYEDKYSAETGAGRLDERYGPAVLSIYSLAPQVADIRACVGKAIKT
jgi:hypothetical protein